jgi:hypothetical protein
MILLKTQVQAGSWWLTPVQEAAQESEIRRIKGQRQPGQIVPQDPISKKPFTKIGLV